MRTEVKSGVMEHENLRNYEDNKEEIQTSGSLITDHLPWCQISMPSLCSDEGTASLPGERLIYPISIFHLSLSKLANENSDDN